MHSHRSNKYVDNVSLGPLFTFLPAFELGPRKLKKQADGGILPLTSRRPSVVLEVGNSESLTQLKIDAKLWVEHTTEVSQFLFLVPSTHHPFLRYSWSCSFQLTRPFPPYPIFQESPSNYGEALTPLGPHAQQLLGKGRPKWSGVVIGPMLRRRSIYGLLTFSEDRCLLCMATTIVCIWILHAFGKGFSIHILYNNAACWKPISSTTTLIHVSCARRCGLLALPWSCECYEAQWRATSSPIRRPTIYMHGQAWSGSA